MEKRFLTVKETSQEFFAGKVSSASIYRLAASGDLPAIKIGKKLLINAERLEAKYA